MPTIPSSTSASEAAPSAKPATKSERLLIGLFVALLIAPILIRPKQVWACLYDRMAEKPALRDFAGITEAVGREFPYRKRMMRGYNTVRLSLFGLPPRSVVIGRQGWLYYDSDPAFDGAGMRDYLGLAPLTDTRRAAWRAEAALRQEWFTTRGIEYLLVIAPNKQSLYPQFLPSPLDTRKATYTSVHEFLDEVHGIFTHDPLFLLSSLSELAHARTNDPLYLLTDTHWNGLGAWSGYQSIVAALPLMHKTPSISVAGWRRDQRNHSGDIAAMAMMHDRWREQAPILIPDQDGRATFAGTTIPIITADKPLWNDDAVPPAATQADCPGFTTEIADPTLPTAIVFSDSFGSAITPFLAQHFRSCLFVRDHLDAALITRLSPDVVIQLSVERYLDRACAAMLTNKKSLPSTTTVP